MKTLIIVLSSPIWIALLAAAAALYVSALAVIASLWVVFAALLVAFVAGIIVGIIWLISSGLIGLAMIGAALVSLGLSLFAFLGSKALTIGFVRLTKMPFD